MEEEENIIIFCSGPTEAGWPCSYEIDHFFLSITYICLKKYIFTKKGKKLNKKIVFDRA